MEAWKIAGLVVGALASVAAILGGLYGIVTAPILRTLTAEMATMRAEMGALHAEIKLELVEMEKRLNERIDTRLVHR
jgi:hypothetical protein